ncbi:MBL fold metallo-hydrolase [Rurimicrobium arvi]|uniref:MBL fold metallo-hydrolase n=1 Tax=Rurimicrobium arvi TaxID=2049916 RepID=A0ABP8MQ88_9BACT
MKLYTIDTGLFKLDGGAMHGVVPKSMWQKQNPADENNMCTWAMRCLLIDTGSSRILIDCGIGDKQDEKFLGHYYLHGKDSLEKSLKKHGYSPADITDLFLTHLHFDHCGGAIKKTGEDAFAPVFENAVYWSDRLHWKAAIKPNDREKASFLKENILPLQECGKLSFVEAHDGGEWKEEIRIRYMQGHTESMMLPLIPYNGRTVLYCADLIPSAAHVSLPWVMAYDMKPLETLSEKKEMLEAAAENNWVLFFEHDPHIECATVQMTEKGVRIKSTFKLSEIDKH